MTDDWTLTPEDLDECEWFRWDRALAESSHAIGDAVSGFEAHASNAKVAADAEAWLKNAARDEAACVTRLLVCRKRVAAFYALASGEAIVTSTKKLEQMGIRGGQRVGSSHIEWIARDRRAPGAGDLALKHALYVAEKIAELQGNRALTLDPYDAETQAMWRAKGFRNSQTELQDGLRRLYVPLFGRDYGRLRR